MSDLLVVYLGVGLGGALIGLLWDDRYGPRQALGWVIGWPLVVLVVLVAVLVVIWEASIDLCARLVDRIIPVGDDE